MDAAQTGLRGEAPFVEAAALTRTTPLALTAALVVGCAGVLMLGVQPMVLGALVSAQRLDVHQLAQAATVEMLALGVVAALLAGMVRHRGLHAWGLGGLLLLGSANLGCLSVDGVALIALRGLAGAGGGILVWIATGLVTRHAHALRLSAIFLGAQALSQAGLAAMVPAFTGSLGADAGLVLLAVGAGVGLPFLLALPRDLPDLPKPETGHGSLTAPGAVGLLSTFLLMAGIVGVWVFVEQFAKQHGIAPATVSFSIAASLATQVAGAAFIAWIGPRVSPAAGLVLVSLGYLLSLVVLAFVAGDAAYLGATLLFGFLWTTGMPLFVPLLIRVDPTRRAAMLLPGAQLLGSSAGPQITGALVTGDNLQPVLVVGAALFAATIAAVLTAIALRARSH